MAVVTLTNRRTVPHLLTLTAGGQQTSVRSSRSRIEVTLWPQCEGRVQEQWGGSAEPRGTVFRPGSQNLLSTAEHTSGVAVFYQHSVLRQSTKSTKLAAALW